MKLNDLDKAVALRVQRSDLERALEKPVLAEAISHRDGFRFHIRTGLIDDAMAEAVNGAIRAELNRRMIAVDEELRGLGVELESTGGL